MLTHDSFLAAHVGSNSQMGIVGKDNKHLCYNSIHDMRSQSFFCGLFKLFHNCVLKNTVIIFVEQNIFA